MVVLRKWCKHRKFDLKWKIVILYSLDFLEPVHFTSISVIPVFIAQQQSKRQYCNNQDRLTCKWQKTQCKLVYAKREIRRAHLGVTSKDGVLYKVQLDTWLILWTKELTSVCLLPLFSTVLAPFSDEFFLFKSMMIIAAQTQIQCIQGLCFANTSNKVLEFSLIVFCMHNSNQSLWPSFTGWKTSDEM